MLNRRFRLPVVATTGVVIMGFSFMVKPTKHGVFDFYDSQHIRAHYGYYIERLGVRLIVRRRSPGVK